MGPLFFEPQKEGGRGGGGMKKKKILKKLNKNRVKNFKEIQMKGKEN